MGGVPDNSQPTGSSFILEGLPLSQDILAPAKGDGMLWVYSKHYVNILSFDGNTGAQNVQACVLQADYPDQIYLAPALTHEEGITGSHHYGARTGLPWTHAEPSFVKAQGWDDAITLKNNSGDLGSPVGVGNSTGDSLGIWLLRGYSENYELSSATGTGFITIGISAETA